MKVSWGGDGREGDGRNLGSQDAEISTLAAILALSFPAAKAERETTAKFFVTSHSFTKYLLIIYHELGTKPLSVLLAAR